MSNTTDLPALPEESKRHAISMRWVAFDSGSYGVELTVSGLSSQRAAEAAMAHMERLFCGAPIPTLPSQPEGRDTPQAACNRCGGTGFVTDGEITGSGGVEYENGPIKCVKDCPACMRDTPQAEPVAPWPDFQGRPIKHGARLAHPTGQRFTAVFLENHTNATDAWRAVYEDASVSRLCLQIGDKGRAVLSPAQAERKALTDVDFALTFVLRLSRYLGTQLHNGEWARPEAMARCFVGEMLTLAAASDHLQPGLVETPNLKALRDWHRIGQPAAQGEGK